jgi:ribosomal protein S18 acetylase RimI-like enzyme
LREDVRFRQAVAPADPARIRTLVEATGVFSAEEAAVAAELAVSTLDGTETYQFLFAERGDRLLGYTCFDRIPLSAVSFDLYWIAVDPAERGGGLALDLMRRTAALVKAQGGVQIFAETSSREPYAPARAFYRKAGFAEAARFDDFYAPGDAKLVFVLKL